LDKAAKTGIIHANKANREKAAVARVARPPPPRTLPVSWLRHFFDRPFRSHPEGFFVRDDSTTLKAELRSLEARSARPAEVPNILLPPLQQSAFSIQDPAFYRWKQTAANCA
jgi:hypothetical protein